MERELYLRATARFGWTRAVASVRCWRSSVTPAGAPTETTRSAKSYGK